MCQRIFHHLIGNWFYSLSKFVIMTILHVNMTFSKTSKRPFVGLSTLIIISRNKRDFFDRFSLMDSLLDSKTQDGGQKIDNSSTFYDISLQTWRIHKKPVFFGPFSLCAHKTKWKNVKNIFLKMRLAAPRYHLSMSEDRLKKSFLDL